MATPGVGDIRRAKSVLAGLQARRALVGKLNERELEKQAAAQKVIAASKPVKPIQSTDEANRKPI